MLKGDRGCNDLNKHTLEAYLSGQSYDHFPFGVRLIDSNYFVVDINQAFLSVLSELTDKNLSKEGVIGKRCYEIIEKTLPCPECFVGQCITDKKSNIRKKTFSLLQGRTFEIHTQPITQSDGKTYGFVELSIDVTDQQNFEELFNLLSDTVCIVDIDSTKILAANDAACRVLGYKRDQLLNLYLEDVDPNYNKAVFEQFVKDLMNDKHDNLLIETSNIDASGTEFPVEANISIINYRGRKALLGVNRDIRERKLAEKRAREADEKFISELTRLDRLNLIGEMAASISHEIRNPLTTVRGFLQIFQAKNDFAKYGEHLNTMLDEIDRANSIITEFLSLAKNRKIDLLPNNLNKIISKLYPLIQADAIGEGKTVTLELGEIPNTLLDENQIRQCILNLVRNGLEAVKSKGVVSLKTYVDGDNVVLEVKDNGDGIPQDVLEKLGTPFITTKEKGTGLGLPICYRIVERHKAKIEIDTSLEGTKFLIMFRLMD